MSRKLLNQIKRNLKKVGEAVRGVESVAMLPSAFDPEKPGNFVDGDAEGGFVGDFFQNSLRKNPDANWHHDSPAGLFFKMDDVELIKLALWDYKPNSDDLTYKQIDLMVRIRQRQDQLEKIPSGFEDKPVGELS